MSKEQKLFQIWDLCRITANKIFFGPFLIHFPNFGDKFFLDNPALSRTTSHWFLAPPQILEKTSDAIPGNLPDRRTRVKGRTDPVY